MKSSVLTTIIIILLTGIFKSCYYDNEEDLYPTLSGQCDTLNVTFGSKIAPLLNDNCLSCHSNANSAFGGGVKLQDLQDVKNMSGAIFAAINHTGPVPMPPSGKLSQCSIDMFGIWIRNGMPE